MNNKRNIEEETINQVLEKTDRNGNNYLILKIGNDEAIFVFATKVKEDRWDDLKENQKYNFIVEESNNGSKVLIDFEIKF